MPTPRAAAWIAAVAAAVLACLVLDLRLTDGDSCTYGALAHDAAAGSWRDWVAPQWSFHGRWDCFHEHPPGALWPAAVAELAGVRPTVAPLVANVLWEFTALAGVLALAWPFVGRRGAVVAGAAFLLHIPALRYVDRFALEFPIAAAAAWTVAAGLRLRGSAWWTVVLGAALAGAFLVRGVFAGVPLVLVVLLCFESSLRPPPLRLVAGIAVAATILVVFDLLHAQATGHSFWAAYVGRQVIPSIEPGGTEHSVAGHPALYFVGRLAVYSLPWSLLPLVRLLRGPRPLPAPAGWKLAAAWVAATLAGALVTTRPASRYLFEALPALALLAALAIGPDPSPRVQRWAAVLALVTIPLTTVGKGLLGERHAPWQTAGLLDGFRATDAAPTDVRGPFAQEEDGIAALVRFHLRVRVLPESPDAPASDRRWVPVGAAPPPGAAVLVTTPLGSLVAPR